jgi:hypothetical protein
MVKFKNGFTENFMEINFGHPERERITIFVEENSLQKLKPSTENWLGAKVDVQAGGFQGQASLFLEFSDFERFLPQARQLYETLEGEARFDTIEGQIQLVLKGDGKGHINLSGNLLDDCGIGNELSFKLEFDQTLLKRSISEIERFINTVKDKA